MNLQLLNYENILTCTRSIKKSTEHSSLHNDGRIQKIEDNETMEDNPVAY